MVSISGASPSRFAVLLGQCRVSPVPCPYVIATIKSGGTFCARALIKSVLHVSIVLPIPCTRTIGGGRIPKVLVAPCCPPPVRLRVAFTWFAGGVTPVKKFQVIPCKYAYRSEEHTSELQ